MSIQQYSTGGIYVDGIDSYMEVFQLPFNSNDDYSRPITPNDLSSFRMKSPRIGPQMA